MMHFLHLHHTGEDNGLWPLIRTRNAAAAPLLDQMDEDHRGIGPAITALEEAARVYRDDASAQDQVLEAVDRLSNVLLPHPHREELEVMPVVATTLSDSEYGAVEREYFVAPEGLRELGAEPTGSSTDCPRKAGRSCCPWCLRFPGSSCSTASAGATAAQRP